MDTIEKYIENPTIANLLAIEETTKCKKKQLILKLIRTIIRKQHYELGSSMPVIWGNKLISYFRVQWYLRDTPKLYYTNIPDYTRIYVSRQRKYQYISINYFGNILRSKNWESYIPLMNRHSFVVQNYKFTLDEVKIVEKIPKFTSKFYIRGRNADAILYIYKNIYHTGRLDMIIDMQTIFIVAGYGYMSEFQLLGSIISKYIYSYNIIKFIHAYS